MAADSSPCSSRTTIVQRTFSRSDPVVTLLKLFVLFVALTAPVVALGWLLLG